MNIDNLHFDEVQIRYSWVRPDVAKYSFVSPWKW